MNVDLLKEFGMRINRLIAIAGLGLFALLGSPAWAAGETGAKLCVTCHDEEDLPDMSRSAHGFAADKRVPDCITCHGESPTHAKKPADVKERPHPDRMFIRSYASPANERSAACLSCHQKDAKRALWAGSQSGGTVTRIPVGGPGLIPNMLSGNVDAIIAYPPLSYNLMIKKDGRSIVDFGKEMPINLPDVWVASEQMIEKRPDQLRKALTGIYSAVVYMQAHPEWSIDFIAKKTGMDKAIATEEYNNTIKGLSPDGMLKEEWVKESLKLGELAGMKEIPPAASMFTTKFVPVKPITP